MVDDSAVIHVVGVEGQNASGNRDFIYTRGGQGPPDTFTFSPAQRPDSSNVISVIVVASRKSNKVAIVYSRQKSFGGPAADADIFYIESTDAGRDWVNSFGNDIRDSIVNLTKYQPGDPVRVFGDLSAVYDEEDSLHIVWVAPLYSSEYGKCYIYHWSRATGTDQVADGTYNMPYYYPNLNNPHIGVHDGTRNPCRKNFLYVTWTQFGPGTTDRSVDWIVNGDLYVNDKSAGIIIYGDGDPVSNPVLYYKYPAFAPLSDCWSTVSPPIFVDPVVTPGGILDTSFKILLCPGPDTLRVDSIRTKGSSWLQILSLDTILVGECFVINVFKVNIRFDATGLIPSTYIDTLIIYSPHFYSYNKKIPARLVVTDCGYFKGSQVVATVGDLRVKFSNTSNLGDHNLFSGFYLTSINENFLLDGSTVLTTITAD